MRSLEFEEICRGPFSKSQEVIRDGEGSLRQGRILGKWRRRWIFLIFPFFDLRKMKVSHLVDNESDIEYGDNSDE